MNSAIDPVHFWDQFRQTACSKDASSSQSIPSSAFLSPSSSNTPSSSITNVGGDTSSFLVVPTKRNFLPSSTSSFKTAQFAFKTLVQIQAKKKFLLALAKKTNHSKVLSSKQSTTSSEVPTSPSLPSSSVLETTLTETYLDYKTCTLPYLLRECLSNDLETVTSIQTKLEGLLPMDKQWHELNQLRIHAGAPERSEKGIERLLEYYGTLLFLEKQIPFETDAFKGKFTWYDAFHPNKIVTGNCIQYEKASVLFNLAATYAQLGAQQKMWTSDGIKLAAVYFQKAAGVLSYIRDALAQRIRVEVDKSSDLSEATLNALFELMIAQAHECFVEKANMDFASSQLTSQLCAQTGEHYDLAYCSSTYHISQLSKLLHPRFPKTWTQYMRTKHLLYTAVAHFHCPILTSSTPTGLGERIARLIIAKTIAEKALKEANELRGTVVMLCQFYLSQMTNALHLAETENTMKFQTPILDPRLLTPLKRLTQALVVPFPMYPPDLIQKGLFRHVLFDEDQRLCWLQCHLKRAHLSRVFNDSLRPLKGQLDGYLAQIRQWLEKDITLLCNETWMEKFEQLERLNHQARALFLRIQKDEQTFSKLSMMEAVEEVVHTCEEVLNKCHFVLNNVDTHQFVNSPTMFANVDHLRTQLYQLNQAWSPLQTETKDLLKTRVQESDHVIYTWSEEQFQSLVIPLDAKLKLTVEDLESLEFHLTEVAHELKSLHLVEKKLQTNLHDPIPRLQQRIEDAEAQWTMFQEHRQAVQHKYHFIETTLKTIQHQTQQVKDNLGLVQHLYLQLTEFDQSREEAQSHLKAVLAFSEQLNTLADTCETFPVQLPPSVSHGSPTHAPSSLSSPINPLSVTNPRTPMTKEVHDPELQRKNHRLIELKKNVHLQKIKYRLKKAALQPKLFVEPSSVLSSTSPTGMNEGVSSLALQKETEHMIREHYGELKSPFHSSFVVPSAPTLNEDLVERRQCCFESYNEPLPHTSSSPVSATRTPPNTNAVGPAQGVNMPSLQAFEARRQERQQATDEWAATQVTLAKRRKKLWKKSQAQTKNGCDTTPVLKSGSGSKSKEKETLRSMETKKSKLEKEVLLQEKIKSDSGFTTQFSDLKSSQDISETLSLLKLQNDEILAHFSPTSSHRSHGVSCSGSQRSHSPN